MTDQPDKGPGGRPTLYRPEYCEQIIELGKQGKSVVQMANHFEVTKQCMLDWTKVHAEFFDAFTRAKQLSQEWWESTAQSHLIENKDGPRLNHGLWSRSMAARFPDDYREKQDVNLGGQPDNPVGLVTKIVIEAAAAGKPSDDSADQAPT